MRFAAFSRVLLLPALALAAAGCKHITPLDTHPLDQAGMWYETVQQLRSLQITQTEIADVARAREAGLSDAACLELVKLAHSRQQPFAQAAAVVDLHNARVSEPAILELARLDQLASWSGEAVAIRLAGMPDDVLLAVARRRAANQTVPSGPSLARLKGSGLTDAQILELINRSTSDAEAEQIVAARQRAAEPQGFVRSSRRRHR